MLHQKINYSIGESLMYTKEGGIMPRGLDIKIYKCLIIIVLMALCTGTKNMRADDNITLYNHTDMPIYAGLYYVGSNLIGVSNGPAECQGDIIEIPALGSAMLNRPPWRFLTHNREIIFSTHADELKKNLTKKEYKMLPSKSAGYKFGNIYHVVKTNGVIKIYGDVDYKLLHPAVSAFVEITKRSFHQTADYFKQHPYANVQAVVRKGSDLCSDEVASIANRSVKNKFALEAVLKQSLDKDYVPRIGFCTSGGGVRAALCAFGFMEGLQHIGLLDAVAYAAAISGSTWTLSSFLQAGKPITSFREDFLKAVTSEHMFYPNTVVDSFLQKIVYKQPLDIVDLYGVYLANKFFRDIPTDLERQRLWFSEFRNKVRDGSWFFPLCTAIEISQSKKNPAWFTFTPYEVGSDQLGLYIPTWALGRKFVRGVSAADNNPPELRLGYLMGIWGSALSGTFKQLYDNSAKNIIGQTGIGQLIETVLKKTVGPLQIAPVKVSNPFYESGQASYAHIEELTFMDSGYAYNIPLLPLMNKKRGIDIIFMVDASASLFKGEKAHALRNAESHMVELGLKFPRIDYTHITQRAVNVFTDADPETPIIVYVIPAKNNNRPEFGDPETYFASTYATANFSYSRAHAERLIDLMRYNIIDNKDIIVDAIKQKINQKIEIQSKMRAS